MNPEIDHEAAALALLEACKPTDVTNQLGPYLRALAYLQLATLAELRNLKEKTK